MKRSDFKSELKTMLWRLQDFDNENKAERIIELFEESGFLPPTFCKTKQLLNQYPEYFHDDGYHGAVCRFSWRDYGYKLPKELHQYVKVVNCGEYSIAKLDADKIQGWEPEN